MRESKEPWVCSKKRSVLFLSPGKRKEKQPHKRSLNYQSTRWLQNHQPGSDHAMQWWHECWIRRKPLQRFQLLKKNKALGSLMAGHWCQGVCPQGSKSTCWLLWCPIWLSICECFIPETCATALQWESLKARSWWLSAHQDHQSYCHQLSEWEI